MEARLIGRIARRFLLLASALLASFGAAAFAEEGADPTSLVEAEEPGLFNVRASTESTTDKVRLDVVHVDFRSHWRNLFWPYPQAAEKAWDYGVTTEWLFGYNPVDDFSGVRLFGTVGRKFSHRFNADVSLGLHQLRATGALTGRVLPYFGAAISAFPIENDLFMEVKFSHDLVYQDLLQLGPVVDLLWANSGAADLIYRPMDRIRIALRTSLRGFNDGNTRRYADFGVMYGLSIGVPWIWAGAGSEYVSFPRRESGYWSPSRFLAGGPRFEATTPLFDRFSAGLGLNVTRFREESLDPGWGYYATLKLEYGSRDDFLIDLGFTRISSSQNTLGWSSETLLLHVGGPL